MTALKIVGKKSQNYLVSKDMKITVCQLHPWELFFTWSLRYFMS